MIKLVTNKYSVDKKELSVIFTFLGWLILGFIVCFIGINNIFAASYNADNFTAQIYDNVNGTLTAKETTKETSGIPYYYSYDVGYTAYSSGGAWGVSSPIPLLANHTYSMTVDPTVIGCGFTILSSINRLGVGTSLGNAVTSYQNNTNVNEKFSQAVSNSRYLQYVFTPTINASYIVFPYSTTSSCSGRETQLTSIVIEDLGESGVSQDQINISLNNQTNELNNSIQNSTDTITGEINDMENSIIDSNKETQEVIKDQFNSCRDSYNLFDKLNALEHQYDSNGKEVSNRYSLNSNGDIIISASNYSFGRSFFNKISLHSGTYTLSFNVSTSGENKLVYRSVRNMTTLNDILVSSSFTIVDGNRYSFNFTLTEETLISISINPSSPTTGTLTISNIMLNEGSSPKPYEPYGEEICSNKIDETNDKLDDLNGSLNNSNSSGATNDASNFFSNFTTDTFGLTSIITAPLSLINSLTSSSCSTLRLPLPYLDNEYLELPCMETIYNKYFGSFFNIYQTITFGIVAYWVIVRIFNQVKDFKNPDHDEIEVLDL